MSGSNKKEVVIIGAGVAGCHIAWELASDHDVTVIERDSIAAQATGKASGLVAPTMFYSNHPDIIRHIQEFFECFDGTNGFSFTNRHRLDLLLRSEVDNGKCKASKLRSKGFDVEYYDASATKKLCPWIRMDEHAGAIYYPEAGMVNPKSYAQALAEAAEAKGASIQLNTEVTAVISEGDSVTGVKIGGRTVTADTVIIAAGIGSDALLPVGSKPPIRPYRTQCLVAEGDFSVGDPFPLGRVASEELYFRPEEDGCLLVGGGAETIDQPSLASRDIDSTFRQHVLKKLPELIDGFQGANIRRSWAGVDTATPDTRPIIDSLSSGPEGLMLVTGFNGLGVMISPVIGPIVRKRLTGEDPNFSTSPFDLERFDTSSRNFEYTSTSNIGRTNV